MPRHRIQACFALVWTLLIVPAVCVWGAVPSETLLPATTKGFLSTPNLTHLQAQWDKTQLGQLMNDPLMKPFADNLTEQVRGRFAEWYVKLGLTWDDIKDVPSGEVAVARIQPGPKQTAMVVVADVTGHAEQVKVLIQKVQTKLAEQGAKQSEKKVGQVTIVHFDLPKQDNDEGRKEALYFWTDQLLVVADDTAAIEDILARAMGGGKPALAGVPAFRAVMARCQKEVGQNVPQLRWFIEPFGYSEALQAADPDRFANRRKGKSMTEILKDQGFTAIQGIGGFVDCAAEGYEIVHRTAFYAPPPYEKAAKMLVLPNRTQFAPQDWVPRDVATYATGYVDVLNAFDNVGPLFDELFGGGQKNVWTEVLEGLRDDPNGPQIDLRKELVSNLDQRVTMVSDYELPITPESERLLYAIQTKDEKAVAEAIRKTMQNDPTIRKREFKGHVIWETVQPTRGKPLVKPKVELGGKIAPLGPERKGQPQQRLMPTAATTVAYGQLMVASHIEFLKRILEQPAKGDSLGTRLDFKLVDSTLARFGVPENCARSFTRTDEEYRATYELIRQGKMPQSKTLLGQALNRMTSSGKKGAVRKQEIDGAKMPDYQVVRRYLGPGGMLGYSEPDGWFMVGFLLKK